MVNYLAVLTAAIAGMGLGALWYSPLLFGKLWMSLMGLNGKDMEKDKKKGMGKTYAISFASMLVMSYVLAWFIGLGAVTVSIGLMKSFLAWLGFMATLSLNSVLWEGRSAKLYLLNNSHSLAVMLLMGLILSLWV